jgi:hypothetical protein
MPSGHERQPGHGTETIIDNVIEYPSSVHSPNPKQLRESPRASAFISLCTSCNITGALCGLRHYLGSRDPPTSHEPVALKLSWYIYHTALQCGCHTSVVISSAVHEEESISFSSPHKSCGRHSCNWQGWVLIWYQSSSSFRSRCKHLRNCVQSARRCRTISIPN